VTGVALAAALVRLPFLDRFAYPDEAGLLTVATAWDTGGPYLYGPYFVDRPPLLLGFWWLAGQLGGLTAARLLGLVVAAALVLASAWAARRAGGQRAVVPACATAAALGASPLLAAQEISAELLAAPVTLAACAVALTAARSLHHRRGVLLLLTGVLMVLPLLVKQNLVSASVFALALVLVGGVRAGRRRGAAADLGLLLLGAVLVVPALLVWARWSGQSAEGVAYQLWGFRLDASAVIPAQSGGAPLVRGVLLVGAALVSGLGLVLGCFAVRAGRLGLRRLAPVWTATLLMAGADLAGVVLGGSYWRHYLLAALPACVLMVALLAKHPAVPPRRPVVLVTVMVASTLVAGVVALSPLNRTVAADEQAAGWVTSASRPGDTGLAVYGRADLVEGAGLDPAGYPFLWSLPVRVLDPDLSIMRGHLSGASPPTWVLVANDPGSWGLDGDRLEAVLARHYDHVATVCGVDVLRHQGERGRTLPGPPRVCGVGGRSVVGIGVRGGLPPLQGVEPLLDRAQRSEDLLLDRELVPFHRRLVLADEQRRERGTDQGQQQEPGQHEHDRDDGPLRGPRRLSDEADRGHQ
jgi:hypothetical protein